PPALRASRATRRSMAGSSPAASATRCCAANRSSATARPPDDLGHSSEPRGERAKRANSPRRRSSGAGGSDHIEGCARWSTGGQSRMSRREALLVLADGETFEGVAVGHEPETGVAAGEVVFNTALSGYQEIITDPSYAGQVITFTYPHIGNYGVTADDDEARVPRCRGVVVRDLARRPSNWRARDDLDGFLRRHRVPGIAGVDTRRLTRHLRDEGALPGAFGTDEAAVRAAV